MTYLEMVAQNDAYHDFLMYAVYIKTRNTKIKFTALCKKETNTRYDLKIFAYDTNAASLERKIYHY